MCASDQFVFLYYPMQSKTAWQLLQNRNKKRFSTQILGKKSQKEDILEPHPRWHVEICTKPTLDLLHLFFVDGQAILEESDKPGNVTSYGTFGANILRQKVIGSKSLQPTMQDLFDWSTLVGKSGIELQVPIKLLALLCCHCTCIALGWMAAVSILMLDF